MTDEDHGAALLAAIDLVAINVAIDDRVRRADLRRHAEALIAEFDEYEHEAEMRRLAWKGEAELEKNARRKAERERDAALSRAERAEAERDKAWADMDRLRVGADKEITRLEEQRDRAREKLVALGYGLTRWCADEPPEEKKP